MVVVSENGSINERLVASKDSAITTGLKMFKIYENIFTELNLD